MCSFLRTVSCAAVVLCLIYTCTNLHYVYVHHSKAQIETADIRFYERMVHARDVDTARFDHEHRLIGHALGSQQYYEHEWHKWELHPCIFAEYHLCLSRVLDGDMLYHERNPGQPSTATLPQEMLDPGNRDSAIPPSLGPPGDSHPDTGIPVASVPEPASGVLAVAALIVSLCAGIQRSRSTKTSP
jgi:hypothetical protein